MATLELKEGQSFQCDGQSFFAILNGNLFCKFPGGEIVLEQGDCAGILELFLPAPCLTYTTTSPVTLAKYSITTVNGLKPVLGAKINGSIDVYSSATKQFTSLLHQSDMMLFENQSLIQNLTGDYKQYVALCQQFEMDAQMLPGFEKIKEYASTLTSSWLTSFYNEFSTLTCNLAQTVDPGSACLKSGFLVHMASDCQRLISLMSTLMQQQAEIYEMYLNESQKDLFHFYITLLLKGNLEEAECMSIESDLRFMLTNLEMSGMVNQDLLDTCTSQLEANLSLANSLQPSADFSSPAEKEAETDEAIDILLKDSLNQLLAFSELDTNVCSEITSVMQLYKASFQQTISEDDIRRLRKKVTEQFNLLYKTIVKKSLPAEDLPPVVKMFLNYGYVDENLAGIENSRLLYRFCTAHLPASPHVYTVFQWLKAIYEGKKEPSRNEFDEEYATMLQAAKAKGDITPAQQKEMLNDTLQKVDYELSHMFLQVNKMTFGRISIYCPVFTQDNLLKPLETSYVTPEKIMSYIDKIRTADFSAFYRETIYTNEAANVPREFIHLEVLPDVILMPNIGTRGAMWQEIENRRRSTPARMMLSIFHLEDLYSTIIHIVGEYRWELCRRIQGARWNDLSELSLTSEYFDYIQFYRKNNDLSPDAKEKIKSNLTKVKNSYKEMFVLDYIQWILFESIGSPRLNKVARTLLFNYCPFANEIRQTLGTNPMFKELLDRYNIKNSQHVHHLDVLTQKIQNSGKEIPEEIEQEYLFLAK